MNGTKTPFDLGDETESKIFPAKDREHVLNGQSAFQHSITAFTKEFVGVLGDKPQKIEDLPMGGKTINLMQLQEVAIENGFKVPGGYGIGYDAYKEYNQTGKIPELMIDLISHLQNELGGNIAIRSSGNVEDGSKASAAGVFESYYIKGTMVKTHAGWKNMGSQHNAIEYVIHSIYDTTRSEGAITYFQKIGISPEEINMGLTIQKLVNNPAAAGVVLTEELGGQSKTYVNYVHNNFGNLIADGKTPGSSIYFSDDVTQKHVINPNTLKYSKTLQPIASFIVELMAPRLAKALSYSFTDNDSERKTGDIEFAIAMKRFGQFLISFDSHKDRLTTLLKNLTNKSALTVDEVETFIDLIQETANLYTEIYNTHQTSGSKTTDKTFQLGRNILKISSFVHDNGIITNAIRSLENNDATKESFGDLAKGFVDVLQYRELVRPMLTYNPNARGSLASIYNSENPHEQEVTGVIVNIEEYPHVEDLDKTIRLYIEKGEHVILVGDAPGIEHEDALKWSTGALLQSSGSGSHIALRAGEWSKPCIGGCRIDMYKTGMKVTMNTNTMTVKSDDGADLLVPLMEGTQEEINANLLQTHLTQANNYIFEDLGRDEAIEWAKKQIQENCDVDHAEVLCSIIEANKNRSAEEGEDAYIEEGFDDCLSHRIAMKIVTEAFALGGFVYEAQMLGVDLSIDEAKEILGSSLIIPTGCEGSLKEIAKKYGVNQEFLYPGVTKSTADTLDLSVYQQSALDGKPMISVRALTGIGGLRYDTALNSTVDCPEFLHMKALHDKRYYPGVALFHFIVNHKLSSLPTCLAMIKKGSVNNEYLYNKLVGLKTLVEEVNTKNKVKIGGAALLCSSYLPKSHDLTPDIVESAIDKFVDKTYVRLLQAYHSPRSELQGFYDLLKASIAGELDMSNPDTISYIDDVFHELEIQIRSVKTFNSTLHIPLANGKASLANGLMGKIKNDQGVSAIRYGIGFDNQSLEVVQFDFADGKTTYQVKVYDDTLFTGNITETFILDDLWKENIEKHGFLRTAQEYLTKKSKNQ